MINNRIILGIIDCSSLFKPNTYKNNTLKYLHGYNRPCQHEEPINLSRIQYLYLENILPYWLTLKNPIYWILYHILKKQILLHCS